MKFISFDRLFKPGIYLHFTMKCCDNIDDCVGEYDLCDVCNGDNSSCISNTISFGVVTDSSLEVLYSTRQSSLFDLMAPELKKSVIEVENEVESLKEDLIVK